MFSVCTGIVGRTTGKGGWSASLVFSSREVRIGVRAALEARALDFALLLLLCGPLARPGVEVVARSRRSRRPPGSAPRLFAFGCRVLLARWRASRLRGGSSGSGPRSGRWRRLTPHLLFLLVLRFRIAERHTTPVRVLQDDALLALLRLPTNSISLK